MFDKQIALNMTQDRGLGLAEALVRQMSPHLPPAAAQADPTAANRYRPAAGLNPAAISQAHADKSGAAGQIRTTKEFDSPEQFVETLWPLAQSAAAELNTAPELLVAQAALETGWGKYMLRHPDGRPANNLFNIKAGSGWQGDTVVKQTLEYREAVPVQERARFRAYDSLEQSFADYIDFLRSNPRYGETLQQTGSAEAFARSLQRAGYATDPHYADKIIGIMQRNVMAQPIAMTAGGGQQQVTG